MNYLIAAIALVVFAVVFAPPVEAHAGAAISGLAAGCCSIVCDMTGGELIKAYNH